MDSSPIFRANKVRKIDRHAEEHPAQPGKVDKNNCPTKAGVHGENEKSRKNSPFGTMYY